MEEAICCHELNPMKATIGECYLTAGINEQLLVTPVAPPGESACFRVRKGAGDLPREDSAGEAAPPSISSTLNLEQGTVIWVLLQQLCTFVLPSKLTKTLLSCPNFPEGGGREGLVL